MNRSPQKSTPIQSLTSKSPPIGFLPKMEAILSFPSIKPGPAQTQKPKRKSPTTSSSTPALAPASHSAPDIESGSDHDSKPIKKARKSTSASANASGGKTTTTTLTPDIKEALVEHIFRLGYAAMQKDELAAEVSSSSQPSTALHQGRLPVLMVKARDHQETTHQCHLLREDEPEEQGDQGGEGSLIGLRPENMITIKTYISDIMLVHLRFLLLYCCHCGLIRLFLYLLLLSLSRGRGRRGRNDRLRLSHKVLQEPREDLSYSQMTLFP